MLGLLLLSILFYRERAFFLDAGFMLFNLVNEEAIQVYHYRFITVVVQVLPWAAVKAGAPLPVVAAVFSASYFLFFGTIYHLLVRHFQNERLGWALIFLLTLLTFDSFYHIQSEMYLGLALLLLVFAAVLRFPDMKRRWMLPLFIPLLVTIGFSHKLAVIFCLFLWAFFFLSEKALRHWRYWLLLALMLAVAFVKSHWFTNWYEAAKQVDFSTNLKTYFPNYLTLPSNLVFLKRCLIYYYFLPLLLLAVSIFYLLKKRWLKLGLVWSFTQGYLLLYNISDPTAADRFYSEVAYLPAILFPALPFLFDVMPVLEQKKLRLLPALFTAIILLRLTTITWNHQTFERLLDWTEQQLTLTESLGTNRLLLKKNDAPMDTIIMEWGVPFTTMLLSSLNDPAQAKTLLILPDFEEYRDDLGKDHLFLTPFKKMEAEELNKHYFDLGKGRYGFVGK